MEVVLKNKKYNFPICCILFKNLKEDGINTIEIDKYIPNIREKDLDLILFFCKNSDQFIENIHLSEELFDIFVGAEHEKLLLIANFLQYDHFYNLIKTLSSWKNVYKL